MVVFLLFGITSHALEIRLEKRNLSKLGLHKELSTTFIVQLDHSLDGPINMTYIEELSECFYIDIYEMKNLAPDVHLHPNQGYINVETPSYSSRPVNVSLSKFITNPSTNLEITFTFPIHLRYQRSESGHTHAQAELANPSTFFINGQVHSIHIPSNASISTQAQVPIGNLDDFKTVQMVTLSVTVAVCVLFVALSFFKV